MYLADKHGLKWVFRKLICLFHQKIGKIHAYLPIFEFERLVTKENKALELFDKTVRERNQKWWEKIGALRLAHWASFLVAAIWFVLLLYNLLVRLH